MRLSEIYESRSTPVLYHSTSPHIVVDMLKKQRIEFGISVSGSDSEYQRGYPYYLSCARVPYGRYISGHNVATQIEFNRDWFAQRFKIVPIDYWGDIGKIAGPDKFEYEDRILSKKPTVKIDSGTIKAIHQLVELKDDWGRSGIRKLALVAITSGVPYYIYTDKDAFYRADVSGATTLKQAGLLVPNNQPPSYYTRNPKKWLNPYLEFIHKKATTELSPEAKKLVHRFTYSYYERDMINSIEADIHNGRSMNRAETSNFVQTLHRVGVRTVKEFYDMMKHKWSEITQQEENEKKLGVAKITT